MTRLGLLALLGALLLAAPVGGRPPEPDAEEGIRILEADEPRLADRIRIGGPPARYRPVGLLWDKSYEVRVSFPGTNPVKVQLWLEPPPGHTRRSGGSGESGGGGGDPQQGLRHLRQQLWPRRPRHRKLLDAEKVVFSLDSEGRVWLGEEMYSALDVMFRAEFWGRWWLPERAPKLLLYDIELAHTAALEQTAVAVPHSALPLLGTGLLMVVLVAAAMPWWSGKAVPDLLHWLGSSPAAVAARRSRAATKAGAAPPKRRGGAAH